MSKKSIDELLGEFSAEAKIARDAQEAKDKIEEARKAAIAAKTKTPQQIEAQIDKVFKFGLEEIISLHHKMQKVGGFSPSGGNYWANRSNKAADKDGDRTKHGLDLTTLFKLTFSITKADGTHRDAEIKISYQESESPFNYGWIHVGYKDKNEYKSCAHEVVDSEAITAEWFSEAFADALAAARK